LEKRVCFDLRQAVIVLLVGALQLLISLALLTAPGVVEIADGEEEPAEDLRSPRLECDGQSPQVLCDGGE
jgi:hypothetical protein